MDVALVGAGHVVCMIQHDDVGELYFQGFVYAICFRFSCIPTTITTSQPELKYACSLPPKAEEELVRVPCL